MKLTNIDTQSASVADKCMKYLIILSAIVISSCTHKILAKNCDPGVNTNYWICDSVMFK